MRRIRLPRKLPTVQFPLHYDGAPSRRLFFPEWYVTCVRPKEDMPKNYVRFHIPADMTKYDMKEYLKKVYDIPITSVRLGIVGYMKYKSPTPQKKGGYEWKFQDPYKIAHVYLGEGQTFEFPELIDPDNLTVVQKVEQFENDQKANNLNADAKAYSKQYFSNEWL